MPPRSIKSVMIGVWVKWSDTVMIKMLRIHANTGKGVVLLLDAKIGHDRDCLGCNSVFGGSRFQVCSCTGL